MQSKRAQIDPLTVSSADAQAPLQRSDAQNSVNDRMLGLSQTRQVEALSYVVQDNCKGRKAFYMGIGKNGFAKDVAFWSLRCADGRSFSVSLYPTGKTRIPRM